MKQLCGVYDLQTGRYEDGSTGVYKYTNEECGVYWCGSITAGRKAADGKLLWENYRKYGDHLTEQITGCYILIINDKENETLQVFHDRTTSPLTLYYVSNGGKIYVSTSLKWLLKASGTERKFNDPVLKEFLVNGFIYGKDTLVRNVCKLSAFTSLLLQKDRMEEVSVEYPVNAVSKGDALDSWEAVLSAAVKRSVNTREEIGIPLSGGYDSNYIAYIADRNTDKVIGAYSVGGKFGKNELPVVEANMSAYENLRLHTALTDEATLAKLPDIVWRLEGAVYEVGIFLQYALAGLAQKSGTNKLICGECADQVMNPYYFADERIFVSKQSSAPTYYEFSEYPYIFGSCLILKKNGIMSNSFGIETEYPYLDGKFVSVAHALKDINQKDKRIHIAVCRERLPETVVKNIAKIGGATDFHSLFADRKDMEQFAARIEKSEFFKKYMAVIKEASYVEREKQTGIKRIKTALRNIVLDVCHINEEARKQTAYYFEEAKLKEYMCCAYLILFDKLFLSGEYDDKLDSACFDTDLYDLI